MGAQRTVPARAPQAAGGSTTVAPAPSPRLLLDLEVVRERFRVLRTELAGVELAYAVKANPHPAVLALLATEGASFDVASVGELADCRRTGVDPPRLSWGNPVKKAADVGTAVAAGVTRFTTDSAADVDLLARHAPGAAVCVRLGVDDGGSATPFAGKFGVDPDEAVALLRRARAGGLRPHGVGFHPGSQQRDPRAWDAGIASAARVAAALADEGAPVELNLGGGFPSTHAGGASPSPAACARAIREALAREDWSPRLVAEPGRAVVADAGTLSSEVVLVTERGGRRWVYLDVGRYQGLAETENEMIVYRLRTPGHEGAATGPVVLAGPTCDGDDVLYRHADVALPLDLAPGDVVEFLGAGAYTASYASVGFNGLPPLPTLVEESSA